MSDDTTTNIRQWGINNDVPEKDAERIVQHADQIKKSYSDLQKKGVSVVERWAPISPVLNYLGKFDRAVILRDEPLEEMEDRTLFNMFVSYATTNDAEKTVYLYLPRDGRIGGINMPPNAGGIGAALTDSLINGSYSPAIYVADIIQDNSSSFRIEARILSYERYPEEKLKRAVKKEK